MTQAQNQSRKSLQQQLLTQQITLFQHFSTILRSLAERILSHNLSLSERRLMQQELATLKKASQSARARLKTSLRSSPTHSDSS